MDAVVEGDKRRGGGSGIAAMAVATSISGRLRERRRRRRRRQRRRPRGGGRSALEYGETYTARLTAGRRSSSAHGFTRFTHDDTYIRTGCGMPRPAARPQCSKSRHNARIAPLRRARARETHATTTTTTTQRQKQQQQQRQQQRQQRRDQKVALSKRALLAGVFRTSSSSSSSFPSSLHLHQPSSVALPFRSSAVDGGARAYARRKKRRD